MGKNVYTAARAFARMKRDEAEEFESMEQLGAHLEQKAETQADYTTTLIGSRPSIERADDGVAWSAGLTINDKRYPFREHAFSQFSSAIGIPASMLTRCPEVLARDNVMFFATLGATDKRFVRTEGGDVRAFLGGGYTAIDHKEIVESFLRSDMDWDVNFAGVTPKRMFILAIEPDSKFEGPDGSEMSHCTLVGNSETGEGSFFAQDLWYDYICQNRIIWGAKARGGQFRKIHRAGVKEGLTELFQWINSDRQRVVAEAKEALQRAGRDSLGGDDERIVAYMRNRGFALWQAKDSIASARSRWPNKEITRFGIVSGLTDIAQRLPMDDRYELERAAGDFLMATS